MNKKTETENNFTAIWDYACRTDPSATKTSNQGGRVQTSIDGYYFLEKATEIFGPAGIGFGWEVIEERWDDGAPFAWTHTEGQPPIIVTAKTHTCKLKFWYQIPDGGRGEIIQYGHTPAVYKSKYGVTDDGEAPKKSIMDAVKKSLSMLGFGADIFRGKYEDRDYVEAAKAEAEIEKAENRDKEVAAKRAELTDYVNRHRKSIAEAASKNEVMGLEKTSVLHLTRMQAVMDVRDIATAGIDAVAKAAKLKMDQLKSGEKANG